MTDERLKEIIRAIMDDSCPHLLDLPDGGDNYCYLNCVECWSEAIKPELEAEKDA